MVSAQGKSIRKELPMDATPTIFDKHADTFALWGESYAQVRDVTSRVRTAAAKHGRTAPRIVDRSFSDAIGKGAGL
jgi:alkanesulfonate monooxygenase SsuD/methylene tetrahydromethanopterin reductase-like flavin-dependent oxidoreductase (luciferase family)